MLTIKILFTFTIFFLLPVTVSASIVPRKPPTGRLPPRGKKPVNYIPKSKIANEYIVAHNAVRCLIKLPPLTWDKKLARYARHWAKKRAYDCKLIHSMGPYGENLFWGGGSTYWSPTTVVKSWASEKAFYNPTTNSCAKNKMCGHYTQIVWKDTLCFGCASVKCKNKKGTFVTCNYDPPGNYVNEHPYRNLSDHEDKSNTTSRRSRTLLPL